MSVRDLGTFDLTELLRPVLRVTCVACPAQLEGMVPDLGWVYARARHNRWEVRLGTDEDDAWADVTADGPCRVIASGHICDPAWDDVRHETADPDWLLGRTAAVLEIHLRHLTQPEWDDLQRWYEPA